MSWFSFKKLRCPRCGAEIVQSWQFCASCSAPLTLKTPVAQPAAAAETPPIRSAPPTPPAKVETLSMSPEEVRQSLAAAPIATAAPDAPTLTSDDGSPSPAPAETRSQGANASTLPLPEKPDRPGPGSGVGTLTMTPDDVLRVTDAPRRQDGAWLLVLRGAGFTAGQIITLRERCLIGSGGNCELILPVGAGVSALHALLYSNEEGMFIRDLASAGGTLVDGRRVTTQLLIDGSVIQIGDAQFRFKAAR